MKTGEGKTLTGTLAVCLNALSGKGVHVVTVNDYLARRDAEWMGKLYGWLGLTGPVRVRYAPRVTVTHKPDHIGHSSYVNTINLAATLQQICDATEVQSV